jgi:hypothetical protein
MYVSQLCLQVQAFDGPIQIGVCLTHVRALSCYVPTSVSYVALWVIELLFDIPRSLRSSGQFVPHTNHTYRLPRPVMGIAL